MHGTMSYFFISFQPKDFSFLYLNTNTAVDGSRSGNISSFEAMLVAALLSPSTKDPAMGHFFWPMEDTTADAKTKSTFSRNSLHRVELGLEK